MTRFQSAQIVSVALSAEVVVLSWFQTVAVPLA